MKTKELIKQLMEADPSGELECCVDNIDIHYVSQYPSYHDGALQVLDRDESCKEYNIIGGKYVKDGFKVVIRPLAIRDILDETTAKIDYSLLQDPAIIENYKNSDQKTRSEFKEINLRCEWHLFEEWAKDKATTIAGQPLNLDLKTFFDNHIDPDFPYIDEPGSPNDKRKLEWDKTIILEYDGFNWHIRKVLK